MTISETAVKRPILTLMAFTALVVFGLVAYGTLGMALYPDVDMPMVTATVTYEGASPETVETEVTEVLEEALSTINGIKSMRSETGEGVSQVFLEFELERDVDIASQDVRDKISGIQNNCQTTRMCRWSKNSTPMRRPYWALCWPAKRRFASFRSLPTMS